MKFEEIIRDLKNKIYKPIYFLYGEESFFIDKISDYISKNVLNEAEKDFNQSILYGKDSKIEDIINTAKRFPMMANHQVIIVKEAQNLKQIEKLEFYAEQPLNSTILVINYKQKNFDKRKKVYKSLTKAGIVFESKKLYENEVGEWINNYLKQKKYSVSPKSTILLTEFLGTDLSKISNELDKLMISLPEGTEITPKHIEENIGFSKDFNVFELQNALGKRDVLKANRIINHFASNPNANPMVVTISNLFIYFSKILKLHYTKDKSKNNIASVLGVNPFFVQDYMRASAVYNVRKTVGIISLLREYDMKSKGYNNVSTSHGDLLKELIFKILH
jgi:DNA polymerase-3 subunit delta